MPLFTSLLILHIATGGVALAASVTAIAAAKGGRLHRFAGRCFGGAMLLGAGSAILLAVLRPSPFLFLIGVFSGYMTAAGWLAIRHPRVTRMAVVLALVMVTAGTGMVAVSLAALAGLEPAQRLVGPLPIVLAVFGALGLSLSGSELAAAWRAQPGSRLPRHLTLMLGATISSWTAFVVVNNSFLPPLVGWLGPTALLLPVIIVWRRRLAAGKAAHPA